MSLALFLAYQSTKDVATRNTLVKMNLNLARKMAHRAKDICNEEYQDLEQEAAIGLIKAVERFDPKRGCAFSSFAVPYVYGKILQYLRDKGHLIRLSQSIQCLESKGRQAIVELTNELGRKPTLLEIAERLECSVEDYVLATSATRNSRHLGVIDAESEDWLVGSVDEIDDTPELKPLDMSGLKEDEIAALKSKGKGKKTSRRSVWGQLSDQYASVQEP